MRILHMLQVPGANGSDSADSSQYCHWHCVQHRQPACYPLDNAPVYQTTQCVTDMHVHDSVNDNG